MSALFDAIVTALGKAALMNNPLSPEPADHSVGTDPNAPHDRTGSSTEREVPSLVESSDRQAPTADVREARWLPPDERREPINIHPDAKAALNHFLYNDPRYRGVGFSEFIMEAVRARGLVLANADEGLLRALDACEPVWEDDRSDAAFWGYKVPEYVMLRLRAALAASGTDR